MAKLVLKIARFIYAHVSKFGLDYEDEDVRELGSLIGEMEIKMRESED